MKAIFKKGGTVRSNCGVWGKVAGDVYKSNSGVPVRIVWCDIMGLFYQIVHFQKEDLEVRT